MNQYHNIPAELRQRMQWVVCGPDKIPCNPRTGARADVMDPSTWGSFDEACNNGMRHIGFVFTSGDPYCGIDLDGKHGDEAEVTLHQRILTAFPSYTERSASGKGYHIIVRARLDHGRRRDSVEVYSQGRFFIFTGNVVHQAPIMAAQEQVDALVAQMPTAQVGVDLEDVESPHSDAAIHEMACNAANGDKYMALCACTSCTDGPGGTKTHGTYTQLGYGSQSEADFALLSIIAFYTRDNAQVRRIFRCTGLGKRDKALRDDRYLNTALRKIRADEPSQVDFDALRQDVAAMFGGHSTDPAMDRALAQDAAYLAAVGQDPGPTLADVGLAPPPPAPLPPPAPAAPQPPQAAQAPAAPLPPPVANTAPPPPVQAPKAPAMPTGGDAGAWDLVPPGLVGEIAQYIYSSAVRPVREVALVAALGLVAGIAGRAYNVSGTGLNQYLLLVAGTGTGKEDGPKGVERVLASLRPVVPAVDDFVGPGAFASGQGLIRILDKQPSFLSMLGEFGLTLQTLNDPRAPASTQLLKRALLDLYSKSGWNNVLRSTAYSDVEKNTSTVFAPALTFMGDTTPETLYTALTVGDIADGLLPRMTVVEYKGKRPRRNKHHSAPPEGPLLDHLASLAQSTLTMRNDHRNMPVPMDSEGQAVLDDYDQRCDERMREDGAGVVTLQLWNRAHLKAMKVAALLAVGVNHHAPMITGALARWAIEFVDRTTWDILGRFDDGDVGNGEGRQRNELKRLIEGYYRMSAKQLTTYRAKKEWRDAGVVPYGFLAMRTSNMHAFRQGFTPASRQLKDLLDVLVASDWLGVVPKQQAKEKFNTNQVLYYIGSEWPDANVQRGKAQG